MSPAPLEFESGDMLAMVPRPAPRADLPSAFRWAFTVLEALRDLVGVDVLGSSILTRAPTVSTHFSGIGTAELASEFLAAAAAFVLGTSCRLQFVAACEKSHKRRRILAHVVPGTSCVFEDILARAPVAAQLMAEAQTRGVLDFGAAWKKLLQAGLGEAGGKCARHWCAGCPMPSPSCGCLGVAVHAVVSHGEARRKRVASDVPSLDMVLMGPGGSSMGVGARECGGLRRAGVFAVP